NRPGVMASALNVAELTLQGEEVKDGPSGGVYGNAIFVDIPSIDNSNLADPVAAASGTPAHCSVSQARSAEDAQTRLFKSAALYPAGRARPVPPALRCRSIRPSQSMGARCLMLATRHDACRPPEWTIPCPPCSKPLELPRASAPWW